MRWVNAAARRSPLFGRTSLLFHVRFFFLLCKSLHAETLEKSWIEHRGSIYPCGCNHTHTDRFWECWLIDYKRMLEFGWSLRHVGVACSANKLASYIFLCKHRFVSWPKRHKHVSERKSFNKEHFVKWSTVAKEHTSRESCTDDVINILLFFLFFALSRIAIVDRDWSIVAAMYGLRYIILHIAVLV